MTSAGRTAPWMIIAILLAGIGVWLAGRVALVQPGGRTVLGPPTAPTKVRDRTLTASSPDDPVNTFERAASKGIDVSRLQALLRDYFQAGLEPTETTGDPSAAGALEQRQKEWYLDALTTALRLDTVQVAEARVALSRLAPAGDTWSSELLPEKAPSWLRLKGSAPWNLCHLGDRQLALTRREEWENARKPDANPASPVMAPESVGHAAIFFPLLPSQNFSPAGQSTDPGFPFSRLHPSQFQMLLLIDGVPPGLSLRLEHGE